MHTLSVFSSSIAGSASNALISAIPDNVVTTQNNRIVPPVDRYVIAAIGGGTDMTMLFMDSPTLSQNGRPSIYPIDNGTFGGNLTPIMYSGKNGLSLPGREQVGLLSTNANVGAQTHFGALWHCERFREAPPGPYKTVQMTVTGSGGNLVWSLLTPQLTAGLKRGRYRCVGMAAQGTNLLFGRLVFPQQVDRPGCLCTADATTYQMDYFRNGNSGVFGDFDNDNLPQFEGFGNGALAGTIIIYMDIIPTPGTPMN